MRLVRAEGVTGCLGGAESACVRYEVFSTSTVAIASGLCSGRAISTLSPFCDTFNGVLASSASRYAPVTLRGISSRWKAEAGHSNKWMYTSVSLVVDLQLQLGTNRSEEHTSELQSL